MIAAGRWAARRWVGTAAVALTLPMGLAAACAAGSDEAPIPAGATTGTGGGTGGGSASCEEQPCKLVAPQCGCAAGERCTLAGDPATRACVPEGDKTVTQACGECVTGLMCIDNGTDAPAMCHQFCIADSDCGGAICVLEIENLAKLCSHLCDPIARTGCAEANTKCDLFQESEGRNRWYTLCGAVGAGTQGDACAATKDCAAGFGCVPVTVDQSTELLCVEWCNVANPTCGVGTCEPFVEPILVGDLEYGACLP